MIHVSGHTYAQAAQPIHESGSDICEKLYPLEFASFDSDKVVVGQATTHKSQPLQCSIFTTIAPLNFAMIFLILYRKTYLFQTKRMI